MNIDAIEAGPSLDAMVAEKVMGWKEHHRNTAWWVDSEDAQGLIKDRGVHGLTCGHTRWSPSTNIAAAWEVVEKMRTMNVLYSIAPCGEPEEPWCVKAWVDGHRQFFYAKTIELAICRAAIKAVGA